MSSRISRAGRFCTTGFCLLAAAWLAHATEPAAGDELLVYKDGDRVRGHLVERTADTLVFQSDKFGLLRVPTGAAEVIPAGITTASDAPKPPQTASAAAPAAKPGTPPPAPSPGGTERVSQPSRLMRPLVTVAEIGLGWPKPMADALRRFFGPWQGRFSFATEMVSDTTSRKNYTVESMLKRKWSQDDVQLTARYYFSETDRSATTDTLKVDGSWRHDFTVRLFSLYRPTVEWNRAYYSDSLPADYVSLQQEFGAGVSLLTTETRKLRVGLSESVFDLWNTSSQTHTSHGVSSGFSEVEAKLPWQMTLTERVVWYFPVGSQSNGWENRFELNKKLTETLTVGMQHDVRRDVPDVSIADYELLKVLIGFDF